MRDFPAIQTYTGIPGYKTDEPSSTCPYWVRYQCQDVILLPVLIDFKDALQSLSSHSSQHLIRPLQSVRSLNLSLSLFHLANQVYTDRPIQSSALGLFATGSILVLLAFTFGHLFEVQNRSHDDGFSSSKQLYGSRNPSPNSIKNFKGLSKVLQWLLFLLVVVAICWRVEVFRLILRDKQCTTPGIEACVTIGPSP